MPTTKEIARSASSLAEELYCRRNELSDCEWRLMAEAWITGYAQSEIVRLAEEAGQEARENKGGISTYSKYYRASIVAAWLREKGQ